MSKELQSLQERYTSRMKQEMENPSPEKQGSKTSTSDYLSFKKSLQPTTLSLYEEACNQAEEIIPVAPEDEKIPEIQEALRIGHLNVSPTGTMSFALLVTLGIILLGVIAGIILPTLFGSGPSLFVLIFTLVMAGSAIFPLMNLPFLIANSWRMKASNQMVMAVFYVVTFMRHTPNLELAIQFAGDHLGPPLNLDFRKVLWNVETGQYSSITESLDDYLETWRDHSPEFIEAMHLIESSLFESSESRRQDALDKSLDVILDETYEKMLHFSHGLKEPINMLNMLGIVLPVLGLIILPMVTSFMQGSRWWHIMMIYNIFLPIVVYYMGTNILSNRPTGYGGVDVNSIQAEDEDGETSFKVSKEKPKKPIFTPFFIGMLVLGIGLFIGLLPVLLYYIAPGFDVWYTTTGVGLSSAFDPGVQPLASLLGYTTTDGVTRGPYGLGSTLLSVFIPIGIGLSIGLVKKMRSSKLIKIREETSELEGEFGSALFQLGNRLGDGVPAELAFSSVAKTMKDTKSGEFFNFVSANISRKGMSVNDAIFDSEQGALRKFPSTLIESSMKVFIQSVKKGPMVASQALLGVARYIKGMHKVDERLQDLLADVLGGMKTQANMLTPGISGVVVGITSLINQLLSALSANMESFADGGGGMNVGSISGILGSAGVPSYYFQAVVGIYVVQITYILSIMINGIQNGSDETYEMHLIGKNMIMSVLIYTVIAVGFTIGFSFISFNVIENIQG